VGAACAWYKIGGVLLKVYTLKTSPREGKEPEKGGELNPEWGN